MESGRERLGGLAHAAEAMIVLYPKRPGGRIRVSVIVPCVSQFGFRNLRSCD